ncbi:MAG: Multidrug resistance protein MdtC [Haliscomenobacter sp.]|jgi:HAE1 family hydrophobic/amphiphilic exporter-1|nr:Multidrug resistance protein MdtC [Haliscomenobacter sp.]
MSITEIAIKRPSLIIVFFTVLTVLGLISYSRLSYELIPKFDAPLVFISTVYPGASPGEVENNVSKKVEDAISSLENITSIRSTSFEGVSTVIVEFKQGTDINISLQDAQRKLSAAESTLPEDAEPPVLSKFSSGEFPIMNVGATGDLPPTELYDLLNQRVKPALSRVDGVGQISLVGGQEREIKVLINRERLESHGLSLLQLVQAVQQANLEFPTGKIKSENSQILVRLSGKLINLDDLRQLVIANSPLTGSPVRLIDVAELRDEPKEAADINRLNGRASIGIIVQKQTDANAVAVSEGIQAEMANLEAQYKDENLKFRVATNTSDFTLDAVDAVVHDIGLAVILVALVMLVFLHSLRNSIIVMVAIPASLVATFIGMYIFGFTLNLMTLLAMSLVIGILVDDSIVVLENIYRHLEMGKGRRQAALDGRREIGFTALSITLVDVVVFVPLALSGGIVGNIMGQFAWVVVFSTLMSLLVSFTVTPMLASRFSKLSNLSSRNWVGGFFIWFEKSLDYMTELYAQFLRWALNRKALILIVTAALFFTSFGLVAGGFIGTAFFGQSDQGEFIMKLELPKDANLKETNLAAQKAEQLLMGKKEVINVFSSIGRSTGLLSQSTPYLAEINVKMVPKEERADRADVYAQRMRDELERGLPGVKVSTSQVSFFGGADEAPIQIILSSTELEDAMAYAKVVEAEVKKIPGTVAVELSVEEGNPELKVDIDRDRMAELGLNLQIVGATMQTAFSGNTNAKYRDGAYEYDINILLDDFDRSKLEDVANLGFTNLRGETIRLEQFANITQTTGPSMLERKDRVSSVTVRSQAIGRPTGTIGEEIKAAVAKNPPPKGVTLAYDGELKFQAEGFGALGIAFGAAILFVYLIMVALYDNWVYPFVVLFSIPVAIVGALFAMALAMQILDIFSIVGIIMLVGLVGKNAILLVDFANQLKEEGRSTFDALIEAGQIRLRPILMTTIAMVFGMLPIALATGAGAEWKNGLAWALVGGLTSSMLLTLIVVPVVYYLVDLAGYYLAKWGNRADTYPPLRASQNGLPDHAKALTESKTS